MLEQQTNANNAAVKLFFIYRLLDNSLGATLPIDRRTADEFLDKPLRSLGAATC
jgi:hypothetical protein